MSRTNNMSIRKILTERSLKQKSREIGSFFAYVDSLVIMFIYMPLT
jgi:hypothetical protein